VLVGKGLFDGEVYEKQLRDLVSRLGLEKRVQFTGFVDEVECIFNTFDIAAHVSIVPDSPVSVMEAMASGCPLIVTAVPGCPELISEGEILLITPGDPVALSQAIIQLYQDPVLRKRLSVTARLAAMEWFNLTASVRSIEKVLMASLQPVGYRT